MSEAPSEFPRLLRLDELGGAEREVAFAAEPQERAALARRFALVAVGRLEAAVRARRDGETVFVEGRLQAQVTQSCVATDVDLPASVDVPFTLRFVPEQAAAEDDERELSDVELDTISYAGSAIDVGEAIAETLALSLDPFPRAPNADAVLRSAGVLEEGDVGPFAGLKDLLKK